MAQANDGSTLQVIESETVLTMAGHNSPKSAGTLGGARESGEELIPRVRGKSSSEISSIPLNSSHCLHNSESNTSFHATRSQYSQHHHDPNFGTPFCCLKDIELQTHISKTDTCKQPYLRVIPSQKPENPFEPQAENKETVCFVSEACNCDTPTTCPEPDCDGSICEECPECEECEGIDCTVVCDSDCTSVLDQRDKMCFFLPATEGLLDCSSSMCESSSARWIPSPEVDLDTTYFNPPSNPGDLSNQKPAGAFNSYYNSVADSNQGGLLSREFGADAIQPSYTANHFHHAQAVEDDSIQPAYLGSYQYRPLEIGITQPTQVEVPASAPTPILASPPTVNFVQSEVVVAGARRGSTLSSPTSSSSGSSGQRPKPIQVIPEVGDVGLGYYFQQDNRFYCGRCLESNPNTVKSYTNKQSWEEHDLAFHRRCHWKCGVAGCDRKKFSGPSAARKHMREHLDEAQQPQCNYCRKHFARKDNMLRHQVKCKTKHGASS